MSDELLTEEEEVKGVQIKFPIREKSKELFTIHITHYENDEPEMTIDYTDKPPSGADITTVQRGVRRMYLRWRTTQAIKEERELKNV